MKQWIQAARLRTLPLSISGIIVGSGIAFSKGKFNAVIFILALITTICFQVLSNFANDYGDGVKGTDNDQRVGPKRALQSGVISPSQMLTVIYASAAVSLFFAVFLIYVSFGAAQFLYTLLFLFLGVASIVAAIKYTMGKNAYGYSGFGDVFVFVFFGLVSVLGSEFLYTQQLDWHSVLPAVTIGCLSVAVLNLNNLRDSASDLLAHKNTLIVKMGVATGKKYHYCLIGLSLICVVFYSILKTNQWNVFIYLITFPIFIKNMVVVYQNKNLKDLDGQLKVVAMGTFVLAILFALGLNF